MTTPLMALIPGTLEQGEIVKERARRAVLQLLVDELNGGGLTSAVAEGVAVGLVQVASWDMERAELADWFRSMAANVQATIAETGRRN